MVFSQGDRDCCFFLGQNKIPNHQLTIMETGIEVGREKKGRFVNFFIFQLFFK